MSKQTITVRDRHGEPVMVIDRAEWELSQLEADERALLLELRRVRREKRQLRDVHSMEGR
jgi:PHD/YefM family antitoxin component YafN of YafNO toxin-antitoxin module